MGDVADKRFSYSIDILEVCQTTGSSIRGTLPSISTEELETILDWLNWRVENWIASPFPFDATVKRVVEQTVGLIRAELDGREPTTDKVPNLRLDKDGDLF